MEYRALGKSGIKVSAYSLGGWTTFGGTIKEQDLINDVISGAFEAGINFFDLADIYGKGKCEEMMGKALAELPRHQLVISSKLFWPMSDDPNDRGLSRKHIMDSVERSLRRLGTDYIDLYFCHRWDEETPLEETVRAMDDLVHQGKILYWGTSEWSGQQLRDAHAVCREGGYYRPQVEQPQYSLLVRDRLEREVRPAAIENGMGLVVWSPLASGVLTGKYDDGVPDGSRLSKIDWLRDEWLRPQHLEKVRSMKRLADELGASRAQLALAWTAAQKGISSVITGATSLAQLQENLGAAKLKLNADMLGQLSDLFAPQHG